MGQNAREFVEGWIDQNVHATGYAPEVDNAEAKRLAVECWAAADQAGVSRASIAEEFNLPDRMAEAIEAVNDAEVERLASKDD